MGDTGLEHIVESAEKHGRTSQVGADSGAVLSSSSTQLSPALTEIIARWARVALAIQVAILAIVTAPA
jgi:hypothetical protein